MNAPRSLADLLDEMPVDGPSGLPIGDHPADYGVLEFARTDDGFRALVRGPSGDIDLVVDDVTGSRIYRDTNCRDLSDAE